VLSISMHVSTLLMKAEFSSRTSDDIYQSKEVLDIQDSSSSHGNPKFRDY